MSQTASLTETPQSTAAGPGSSSGFLMTLIASHVAPIFLGVTGGDMALSRMAAAETIGGFGARNHADLIAVGQIITSSLVALGSLSRSMEDGLPLPMLLRLQGNAIALNRTVEHNRRALKANRNAEPVSFRTETLPDPEPVVPITGPDTLPESELFLNDAAAQLLVEEAEARLLRPAEQANDAAAAEETASITPPPPEEKQRRRAEAKAILKTVEALRSKLRTLPAAERQAAQNRITEMNYTVRELLTGRPPPAQGGAGQSVEHP